MSFEQMPSQAPKPEGEKKEDLASFRAALLGAVEHNNPDQVMEEIKRLNRFLLTESGHASMAEFDDERLLEEIREELDDFMERVSLKLGRPAMVIPMSDLAYTRLIMDYNPKAEPEDRLDLWINENNARSTVFEKWKELGGKT